MGDLAADAGANPYRPQRRCARKWHHNPLRRAGREYAAHSATPKDYDSFVDQISKMWAGQPNWSDAQLKAIDTPILVVDGDHDEAIKREHTEYIAAMIPHTGLLILPNTSHFAFLQDPRQFNFAILHFLGDE
jgi:pimeloyl-ACP methyl ester carboxylesterase